MLQSHIASLVATHFSTIKPLPEDDVHLVKGDIQAFNFRDGISRQNRDRMKGIKLTESRQRPGEKLRTSSVQLQASQPNVFTQPPDIEQE